MEQTGKAKEKFEKWYSTNYDGVGNKNLWHILPDSMKWGVLVDFFDDNGMHISVNPYMIFGKKDPPVEEWEYKIRFAPVKRKPIKVAEYKSYFKTRQEARKEAIKQANAILNKK